MKKVFCWTGIRYQVQNFLERAALSCCNIKFGWLEADKLKGLVGLWILLLGYRIYSISHWIANFVHLSLQICLPLLLPADVRHGYGGWHWVHLVFGMYCSGSFYETACFRGKAMPSRTWMGRVSFFFIKHFLKCDGVYTQSLFKGDGVYTPSPLKIGGIY